MVWTDVFQCVTMIGGMTAIVIKVGILNEAFAGNGLTGFMKLHSLCHLVIINGS